ncbi:MAG: T9SS type A sorting domain-containing protein [Bacteroidales bacterium]|nr:T9SS type A sorting domain-containing protein [Bacteroidales bacterium]
MKTKTIITIILAILVYNANAQDINSLPHFNYGSDTIIYVYISPEPLYLPWGGYGIDITEGNGTNNRWYGKPNTDAIVSQLGDNGGEPYPALVCDTLTAFGYNDWYLPAFEECIKIEGHYEYDWGIPFYEYDVYHLFLWTSNEHASWPEDMAYYWDLGYNGGEVCPYGAYKNQSLDFTCIRREYVSGIATKSADDMFTIESINNNQYLYISMKPQESTTHIEIYDLSGRLIMHKEITPKATEHTEIINTGGFAKSVYIVHVWSGELSKTQKFVVE